MFKPKLLFQFQCLRLKAKVARKAFDITRLENARLSIGQLVWRLSHVQGPARMRSSERPTSEGCGETLTGFREEGEQDEGKVRGR